MIVKTDRDGSFYVAGNGNWRVAGPFSTNAEAWAWIDKRGFRDDHIGSQAPSPKRLHIRQPRDNKSVGKQEVLSAAPKLLRLPLADNERSFVMSMEKRAKRKTAELRLTDRQAGWWRALMQRWQACVDGDA
ncbi:hypothetical protein SAMN06297251_10636 [Fulvimarina manganoxydans]|uniref:Uncharacterized protein n=1 Tax=Fulvimarina manganoxydans TaxID=937218 RepID=A0A1W2BBJ9_9HYPH|nr:hypothetical protein [Fulvimarina manganoxydans]SMC70367.1 hypothetical protein SAMN06297251_10636 [Fulvimarina manganoxydans]